MANLSNINNKFLVTTGGNVLIGQTSAVGSSILQVTGNSTFAGNVTSGGVFSSTSTGRAFSTETATNVLFSNVGGAFDIIFGDGGVRYYSLHTPTGAATGSIRNYNSNDIITWKQTGEVGIGTDSPQVPLQIGTHLTTAPTDTGLCVSNRKSIRINDADGSYNFGVYIKQNYSGSSYLILGTRHNGADTDALFVKSGNVGIGTDSPSSKLDVVGTNTSSNPLVELTASGTGLYQRGVRLLNGGMSAPSSIMYAVGYADNARNMGQTYFHYAGAGSTSNRLSMGLHSVDDVFNILGTGNVGIGATSPSSKLQVGDGTTNVNVKVFGSATSGIQIHTASGNIASLEQYFGDEGSLWLRKGATTKVLVRADGDSYFNGGNVGIGLLLPTKKFEVNSGTISDIVRFGNDAGGIVFGYSTNLASIDLIASQAFRIRQGSTTPLYIKSDGNVGIGITTPYTKLVIGSRGTAAAPSILAYDGIAFDFYNNGPPYKRHGVIISQAADASESVLDFNTKAASGTNSTKMTILGNGNVGIGTTSPSSKLHIVSDEVVLGSVITDYRDLGVQLATSQETGNSGTGISFDHGALGAAIASARATTTTWGTDLRFYTHPDATTNQRNVTERMRITSGGRILMPGLDGKTQVHPDVSYRTSDGELFYQTSSERYKTDIVDLENCLDKVNSLRTVRFTDTNTNEPGFGLIAEETNEIIPDVVFSKNEQIEGISYSNLVPFLIKSIQELKAEIELLKSK